MTDRPDRTHDELFPAVDLQVQGATLRGRVATGWARTMVATLGSVTGTIGSAAVGFRGRARMGEVAVEIDATKRLDGTTRLVELDVESYCEVEVHVEVGSGQSAAAGRVVVRLDEAR